MIILQWYNHRTHLPIKDDSSKVSRVGNTVPHVASSHESKIEGYAEPDHGIL